MIKKIKGSAVTWTAHNGIEPELLTAVEDCLRGPAIDTRGPLIKDNNVRSAFFLESGVPDCPSVFVKWFKKPSPSQRIKHLFVPSKALSEWRNLRALEQHGLPCARPLAFFEKRSCGMLETACLITQCLENAQPLIDVYERRPPLPAPQVFELTRQLARLSAAMHAAGFFFRDYHAGNIMIRPAGTQGFELFLIDLHRARHLNKLRPAMVISDLAQLANSLPTTRSAGLRFLKEYYRHTALPALPLPDCARKIILKASRLETRRIISRSKRCIKKSSTFEVSRSWCERYCGRRDFGRTAAREMIKQHLGRREQQHAIIKTSSKSTLTIHAAQPGQPLCVKGYRYRGIGYAMKNLFRKSRALKCWLAANALGVRGIQTPRPLAMVERRCGPMLLESFYICCWLDRAPELNTYITARAWPETDKKKFIEALGTTIAKLHARGIYHADLKSNNILVAERESGWDFFFIDLDRVYVSRPLTFKRRANNLAQINASVAAVMTLRDRLRFFRIYSRIASCYTERKRYYNRIIAISRTKVTEPYGLHVQK